MAYRKLVLFFIASTLVTTSLSADVLAQAKDGAVLGGVAGAVIGGIIGHQNDETPEGALIGGAVGALAGGVIGKQQQQQQQIRYYEQQQAYQAYQARQAVPVYTTHVHSTPVYTSTVRTVPARRPVCVADVIALTRSGVSESVIVNQIHANGVAYQPSTDDVLTMHDAGVCDYIIEAMQRAPVRESVIVSQPTPSRQVVIHEEYQPSSIYVTRPIYPSSPPHYHPAHNHYPPSHNYRRF